MDRWGERADLRTRLADRANALVWRAPLPRRLQVLLSQLVYKNPPIPQERALEAVAALEGAGIETVLMGGWGVDALSGRQRRPHGDLDLLVDRDDLERAIAVLRDQAYEPWNRDPDPGPIGEIDVSAAQTLRDRGLRVVDLHAVDLGRVRAIAGTLGARRVACLPATHQLQAQLVMGAAWTPRRRRNRRRNLASVREVLGQDAESA